MTKVAVITGASGGIGAALTLRLSSEGYAVVIVARRDDRLQEVARQCNGEVLPIVADVTRRHAVREIVGRTLERYGHIDVWVNNVGRGITRLPSEITGDDVESMMRINVLSAMYGMQEVLPHFKIRGEGQIINISSMLGRIPFATERSAYCGAKHFLNALTAAFRQEVQQTHPGITISLVSPGVVYTDFGNNAEHGGIDSRQLPGGQTPEEVADLLLDVIEHKRQDVYTRPGSRQQVLDYLGSTTEDPGYMKG